MRRINSCYLSIFYLAFLFMKQFKFRCLFIFILFSTALYAQINNYPWPATSELQSGNYSIRFRQVNANGATGSWESSVNLLSIPRDYKKYTHGFPASEFTTNGHNRVGGEAIPGGTLDRNMTFSMFSFTGKIEVEVTKLFGTTATQVNVSPKAFGINPHFFDGKVVRFYMDKPLYVSVDFVSTDNRDDDGRGGKEIKYSCMIFADSPESTAGYTIPKPTDPGVVVWKDDLDLATILAANIIYFPAGDHNLKKHKNNVSTWYYSVSQYDNTPLYHGKLNLAKDGQKVYLAPGAYVRGSFHSHGHKNNWLYGRGIVSGRSHLMHEIIRPVDGANGIVYVQTTQSKEAFCEFGDGAVFNGVVFKEAYHHTCPSGKNSTIKNIKIVGWCYNNDGIRPSSGSVVDGIFIKTCDDYDYARDPHTVSNSVFWPGINGAVGQLGWSDLGSGGAEYYNNYIINSEWSNPNKDNVGIINGSKADAGIKLDNNVIENMFLEGTVNYLVNAEIEAGTAAGYLKNFTFKNISVEKMFQTVQGEITKQKMKGLGGTKIQNWTFTNLFVGGVLVTKQNYQNYFNLKLDAQNNDLANLCENIVFNSEGPLYTITVTSNEGGTVTPLGNNGVIQVAKGMNQQVTISPNSGKRIVKVVIDGVNKGRIQNYVFSSVAANHTVVVEYAIGEDYYGGTDNALPLVQLTSPVANASFTAPAVIALAANATDEDGTITKVEFYADNLLLNTDLTAPYEATWNNVPAGTYKVTAKATDSRSATKTSTAVTVTVNPANPCTGNTAPTVSLTAPVGGSSFSAGTSISLTASATDNGTITKVDFYNGTTLISTDSTAPYTATISNAAAGSYSLTAKATDNCGATKTSTAIVVTVNLVNPVNPCTGNTAPTVSLTAPTNGASFAAGASIGLTASATDNGTITKVDFYNGTTLIATDSIAPYTATISNAAGGSYSLTAKATDNCGATKTSTAVAVTVADATSTGGISGVTCGSVNGSATFTLAAADRVNATSYAWWYTGSSQSITPIAGMPYKAELAFGPSLTAGEICVGVNYSVAPWYKQFCKTISVCKSSAKIGTLDSQTALQVAPNPFNDEIHLQLPVQTQVQKVTLLSVNGAQIMVHLQQTDAGRYTIHVPIVAAGYYILKVQTQTGVKVMRMIHNK